MFTASRLFLLATALAVAAPLSAQQAAFDSSSHAAVPAAAIAPASANAASPAIGPIMQPATVGFRVQSASAPQPMTAMYTNGETPQNTSLMVVGGAALIVGALVGGQAGSIVMIGGGILGLVGLFRYLQ